MSDSKKRLTSLDVRDQNFLSLRDSLDENRREVLCDLAAHGPCTTRQLADATRRDILSIRPRVTELLQLGLVILHGRTEGQGIYRIADQSEWEQFRQRHLEETTTGQLQMI